MSDDAGKPPFARHGRYYLALKIVVLAAAILVAIKYFAGI